MHLTVFKAELFNYVSEHRCLNDKTLILHHVQTKFFLWLMVKGTVSVISSGPQCKDDSARFPSVPLKFLSDQ